MTRFHSKHFSVENADNLQRQYHSVAVSSKVKGWSQTYFTVKDLVQGLKWLILHRVVTLKLRNKQKL